MKNYFKTLLLATLIPCFSANAFLIQARTEANTESSESAEPIELRLNRPVGKIETIKVQVGAKTYNFLFDSGGGSTVITPDVAQEIGCKPVGHGIGLRATGERLENSRCEDVPLQIGGYSTVTDTGIYNVMSFFDAETPPLGGIISLQTFEDHAVTIDLANNRLIIESDKSLPQRIADMKPLRSRLSRQVAGATVDVFVAANTPHGRIWLELDSGNFGPVFLAKTAIQQLGIDLDAPNKARLTKPVKIDLIGYGPIEVGARERDIIYDGQLNFDAISKLLITIDLRTGRVWARANQQTTSK